MIKVLIGSPIRQKPKILKEFLASLKGLNRKNILLDFYFVDDNDLKESSKLLNEFKENISKTNDNCEVIIDGGVHYGNYQCTSINHQWNNELIKKVAAYKNGMLNYCNKHNYDYLFLIDSDLYLHTETLKQLISTGKDIISEIFWTKWTPDSKALPQVWMYDQYAFTKQKDIANNEAQEILEKLKVPGVYKVGGLGACTLISKKAIAAGVNYNELYNISFWGEDRHFSIKAVALGFDLYVDTNYPAYHIYRESELEGLVHYKENFREKIDRVLLSQKTEVINIAKNFIKDYLSCDYRIATGFEGFKYLSPRNISKNTKLHNEILDYLKNNKVRCSAEPNSVTIEDINNDTANINVHFVIKTKNADSIRKYSCKIILRMYQQIWLVDSLFFYNDKGTSLLGDTIKDVLESKCRVSKVTNNKITLAMLVRNEAGKFLENVLSHASQYIDYAVILDDASDDNTVDICKGILSNIPLQISLNKTSMFHNEISVRTKLWNMATSTNPDWILCLDADEIFENKIVSVIQDLINQDAFDYYNFRLYDLWNNDYYREDAYWHAHHYFRTFLVRYQSNFNYEWINTPQHCGRFPSNLYRLKGCQCSIRLKHYGWSTEALRQEKYKRYLKLDPEGKYGNIQQYRTILDPYPTLIKWNE
ncbi:glycosyltransferase family 2 protein [Vallitalea maricola]|uniref:Uncharacterized protein n=1 Tax=Vallitalea maricola TaxID=3074433 RepID=A0ACB5UMW1_9FIRM|nr:hypothetical protein AN2V17_35540 [Vallitalea sp. AN17-2]